MLKNETTSLTFQEQVKNWMWREGGAAELLFFGVSTAAFQFSRLFVSLVVAQWVGPDEFGGWNVLNLLRLYGVMVTFGVPNGMNRNVPILRGQGNSDAVGEMLQASFWFVLLVNMIGGGAIALFSLWFPMPYKYPLLWMGFLFGSWQLNQYFQLSLKAQGLFKAMSQQQFIFSVLLPIVALPLAYIWGISGFIVGQAIVALFLCGVMARIVKRPLAFQWNWSVIKALISSGWPIMLAGLVYSLLTTTDRWIIAKFLGIEALGQYTLAILCVSILSLFPSVISQQMYPRMAYLYGKVGKSHALIPLIKQQTILSVLITWPMLLGVYFLLPWIVSISMPEYTFGIKPAQYLLLGLAMIPFSTGFGNFLNTIGKQNYYLMVQIIALILSIVFNTIFVHLGWGLNGIGLGSALAFVFYTATLAIMGMFVLRQK